VATPPGSAGARPCRHDRRAPLRCAGHVSYRSLEPQEARPVLWKLHSEHEHLCDVGMSLPLIPIPIAILKLQRANGGCLGARCR
jgi:hypothetical protein